jgi:hypothetical protein
VTAVSEVMAAIKLYSEGDQPVFDTLALEWIHAYGKYDKVKNPQGLLPTTYHQLNRHITAVVDYQQPVVSPNDKMSVTQLPTGPSSPVRILVTDLPLIKETALDAVLPPMPTKVLTGTIPIVDLPIGPDDNDEHEEEDDLEETEDDDTDYDSDEEDDWDNKAEEREREFTTQDRVVTVDPEGTPDEMGPS